MINVGLAQARPNNMDMQLSITTSYFFNFLALGHYFIDVLNILQIDGVSDLQKTSMPSIRLQVVRFVKCSQV